MASAQTAASRVRFVLDAQPLWRLLTSARFAVLYIAVLAAVGLMGVIIPQIPEAMRGNDAAVDAWVESQRDTFGPFTDPMHSLGLFNVFSQRWFALGLTFLVVNISVCTFNRWAPTLRNVFRPPREVPSSFYDRAHNRTVLPPVPAAEAESALRSLRFRVERRDDADATYLFADRFPWTQLATFISHLALILFIAGGLVTALTGFSANIPAGEGTIAPVFAVTDPNQMQIRVDDAVGTFGPRGNPLDFRTHLTIFRNGEEVKSGVTTVNDPLTYDGYRFHQSGFFPFGAALRIRDAASGDTVFAETFPLEDAVAAPLVTITSVDGDVVLSDVIAPTDLLPDVSGALVRVPGADRVLWIGIAPEGDGWRLVAYDPQAPDGGAELRLAEGGSGALDDLLVKFERASSVPSATARNVPGLAGDVLAQLHDGPGGEKLLTLISEEQVPITLSPGEPVQVGGLVYLFEGQREFAGISVRKDSGHWFIWVATGLLLAGLAVTFYVPRRRLWLKLTPEGTRIAALAEKSGGFERDMRELARRLRVPIPPELEEER